MRTRSVVWVALLAIAFGSVFAVGQANPTGGPDDAPYFSTSAGGQQSCFDPNTHIYVSFFDTGATAVNKHVNAVDKMYVVVDSQSTEGCGNAAVSGHVTDGTDVGTIVGDSLPSVGGLDTLVKHANGPNAAVLELTETGLNTGLFIGDVWSTPITVLEGDMVTVGHTSDDQDKAYVSVSSQPGQPSALFGWFDSVTTPDPGDAGTYGAGDDVVVYLKAWAAFSSGAAQAQLYWRMYDFSAGTWSGWSNAGWTDVTASFPGAACPEFYLELTAPSTAIDDIIEVRWQPGGPTATCIPCTPLATTIVDQPVDVANATYTTITVAPDNYSTGFVRDYMTIHAANAAVAGHNWTIGVHGAGAPVAYDYTHDTFPINIGTWNHLTIIGGSQPIVEIDNGSGLGFDIQAGGHFTTIDNLDIRSASATTTRLIQLTNGPTDVTIKNCTFSTVGNASMGINVGAAGSTRLTINSNVWTSMDAGDGAIWTEGPNPNITVTNNTFNGGGTASGYCIQGMGWSNGLIDNNAINNTAAGGILLLADNAGVGQASTPVTITRNTITNSANGIRFNSSAALGSIANVTIEGNLLTGNTNAIRVVDTGGVINSATFTVQYNHIVGNTTGINDTDAGGVLVGELNWWGSTTGPAHALNADGAGDVSTDNVDYRPWLNGAPFAGVGVTLGDNTNAAVQGNKTVESSSWYWTINQALAAVPGCTVGNHCQTVVVDVADGTYAEEVLLDAYANIGTATIRSRNGAAATNVEAGVDGNIFRTDSSQTLYIGSSAAIGYGFHIYFDTAAVSAPSADKILHQGATLGVYDSTIDGTTGYGVHVNGGSANGMIGNNTITGCDAAGVYLQSVGSGLTVDGNTIEYCGDGITVDDGGNTLVNNVIRYNNHHGIDLNSDGNQVGGSGNSIYNNTESGLRVNGDGNTVEDNEIHANGLFGVLIESGATGNHFDGNKIYSNGNPGVQLNAAAGNVFNTDNSAANTNCIWDNDFNGNYGALPYGQMENTTTTLVDATHNYWGSPDGPFNAMRNPSGDPLARVSDFIDIASWAITCGGASADATITLECGAGWYMTSIPLVPTDGAGESIYDELPVFAAYKWEPAQGQYDNLAVPNQWTGDTDNLTWSDGYWLWLMGDETVTVEGATVVTDQVFVLGAAGWQQFSVPSVDMPITGPDHHGNADPDIEFSPDGVTWYNYTDAVINGLIMEGVFKYDSCYVDVSGNKGRYVAMGADGVLDPWLGYWIETLVANVQVRLPVAYWIANPWTYPRGFQIKSVNTAGRTPPAPPTLPAALRAGYEEKSGLVVLNEPNPIRDVNTTTFKVKSAQVIEEIRVEIFDQSGVLVFTETQVGDELVWHTQNDYGEYLANGVYLYRVSVMINGQWVVTQVRKLAINR